MKNIFFEINCSEIYTYWAKLPHKRLIPYVKFYVSGCSDLCAKLEMGWTCLCCCRELPLPAAVSHHCPGSNPTLACRKDSSDYAVFSPTVAGGYLLVRLSGNMTEKVMKNEKRNSKLNWAGEYSINRRKNKKCHWYIILFLLITSLFKEKL